MENTKNLADIPAEKFEFAQKSDFAHDTKFDTKPSTYLQDAFRRFCKNRGSVVAAVVIIILILFAIIVPFCTEYTVDYEDITFAFARPKSKLFANTNFWDGCSEKTAGFQTFIYYYAMGEELVGAKEGNGGYYAIKNQSYKITSEGLYSYRLDSYHSSGCEYKLLSEEEYKKIQDYQNTTGKQVLYPTVSLSNRPTATQDQTNANYYYVTQQRKGKTEAVLDENGNVQPAYWLKENPDDGYYSLRIEGTDGIVKDGKTYYYMYARQTSGSIEVRVNYYEYYIYYHTQVAKDGITEPCFLLGATHIGKDVLTCLASGARFSFIFAIVIASINLVIGAVYGAIAGYYGGAIDLVMERITDILSAVPMMIIITLLKYHMNTSGHILILFLAFIATGWIGMASTTRMQFYRVKNQEYILAARTLGAKDRRLIWKHIFPNAIGTLVTSCALVIPSMIFSETSLSYLGIINLATGNITSVGTLIAAGQPYLTTYPHIVAFPSVFLALLMLSFNLFGNGLRDAFNPSLRDSEG